MSLSRSIRTNVVSLLGLVALLALGYGVYVGIRKVVQTDVMKDYRPEATVYKSGEGVIIKGFKLRSYRGERLVAEALVKEATMRDDRSTVQLVGVSDGVLHDKEGDFQFTAGKATYGTYSKSLICEDGINVWNQDVNLIAAGFTYDHNAHRVTVRGSVTGKLSEGDLTCQDTVIDMGTNTILAGPVAWVGPLAVGGQEKTEWRIQAENVKISKGVSTYMKARGEDKETIVSADKMTYDRKEDVVTGEGNVTYFGRESNLTCERIVIYRKEGRAVITGKVNMLVKAEESAPKQEEIPPFTPTVPRDVALSRPSATTTPAQDAETERQEQVRSSENLRQYPIAIAADRVEYWYRKGSRKAVVTGNPFARQQLPELQWRELYADKAEYDGEKDRIVLSSSGANRGVLMKNSLGDEMRFRKVDASTKKGEDDLEATDPMGKMMIDDNERPDRGSGGTGGSTGGGTGGGSVSGKIGRG